MADYDDDFEEDKESHKKAIVVHTKTSNSKFTNKISTSVGNDDSSFNLTAFASREPASSILNPNVTVKVDDGYAFNKTRSSIRI